VTTRQNGHCRASSDRAIAALERKNRHRAWRSWSRCIDYSTLSSRALLRSDDGLDPFALSDRYSINEVAQRLIVNVDKKHAPRRADGLRWDRLLDKLVYYHNPGPIAPGLRHFPLTPSRQSAMLSQSPTKGGYAHAGENTRQGGAGYTTGYWLVPPRPARLDPRRIIPRHARASRGLLCEVCARLCGLLPLAAYQDSAPSRRAA
jgi:hypothetical protein